MNVIVNKYFPPQGFLSINLFGFVFIREDWWSIMADDRKAITINHEAIHTAQMKELLYVFFYIIYGLEWFVRLFINGSQAYRSISFEREAFAHQDEPDYLKTRKHFAQWRKKTT